MIFLVISLVYRFLFFRRLFPWSIFAGYPHGFSTVRASFSTKVLIVSYSLGRHKVENVAHTNNCFLMFFLKKRSVMYPPKVGDVPP